MSMITDGDFYGETDNQREGALMLAFQIREHIAEGLFPDIEALDVYLDAVMEKIQKESDDGQQGIDFVREVREYYRDGKAS